MERAEDTSLWYIDPNEQIAAPQVSDTLKIPQKTFWVICMTQWSKAFLVGSREPHINVDSSINGRNTRDVEEPWNEGDGCQLVDKQP